MTRDPLTHPAEGDRFTNGSRLLCVHMVKAGPDHVGHQDGITWVFFAVWPRGEAPTWSNTMQRRVPLDAWAELTRREGARVVSP